MKFDDFFAQITGTSPYPYQRRLATDPDLPELLRVPTGAGKTVAVVGGWLWRRFFAGKAVRKATPRRLVYCLPMRVLVEQSAREAQTWVGRIKEHHPELGDIKVSVLMGGAEKDEWFHDPEQSRILFGTQDMLLSRALNRGYAADRFHWPIDFGLLNNDCLWVYDEPQLMGNGVATSAQLAGLRTSLGTAAPCASLWMSATLEPAWLDTVDYANRAKGESLELAPEDLAPGLPLHQRMTATKTLRSLGAVATRDVREVAKLIVEQHVAGTRTLVVLNTVERAKEVFKAIKKLKDAPNDVMLVHSRFRQKERNHLNEKMIEPVEDRIIVATQVIEAGVDLSAQTLVTELAPWACLVQRIGRCNRTGLDGPGRVFWIDLDPDKQAAPYEADELRFAREQLIKLEGKEVSPKALDDFQKFESITLKYVPTHVLRRRDLIDLFDTTPDLSGNDVDVTPYLRSNERESDVQVYWRDLESGLPDSDARAPSRDELCRAPVGLFRSFLAKEKKGKKPSAFVWDHLDGKWLRIRDLDREVRPGMTILLPASAGGYSAELGWDVNETERVEPVLPPYDQVREEGVGDDFNSTRAQLTIAEHTDHVCDELESILKEVGHFLTEAATSHLRQAARWHDAGKAHVVFQGGLRKANPALDPNFYWAKSGRSGRLFYDRPRFRHELASALSVLQHNLPFEVAYLVAAHHGKVRLSLRSLPDELPPENPETLFAQGVHCGDLLPEVDLGGGERCSETPLDLSLMQLGGEASWTARALTLRDALGPFRLAYLEALLRSADLRASKRERGGATQ